MNVNLKKKKKTASWFLFLSLQGSTEEIKLMDIMAKIGKNILN